MHNPYSDTNFISFFQQLLLRCYGFLTGNLSDATLASDELQVLVLLCIATSSALVGTFLILKKMTMLANSISHTILIGIVLAYLFTKNRMADSDQYFEINITAMLMAAFFMGLLTAFLTDFLAKSIRLQEEASTGVVFTSLFALGVILVTILTKNSHLGTEVVMGNVDALHPTDLKLIASVLIINLMLCLLFFKEYQITTLDPGLSKALGISPLFFNYLLMAQISTTTVGAFRAVGVLMVLAFITGPPLTARLLTHNLKKMLLLAILLGCLSAILGVALARHFLSTYALALSTSGVVVCTIAFLFLATLAIRTWQERYIKKKFAFNFIKK